LAAEKGRPGERYILGHHNLSLREILKLLAEITGLRAPKIKIPYHIALGTAYFSEGLSRLTRRPPAVEVEAVQLGKKMMFFTAQKAVQELGLPQTPVRIALHKAVRWYLEHGYVREKIHRRIEKHWSRCPPVAGIEWPQAES
jgi:hypothetical protein